MELRVKNVWFDEQNIFVLLENGNEIKTLMDYFPRLKNATKEQRNQYELWNDGKWIHWEDIDEDLSAEGLLQYQQHPISTR